LEKGTEWGVVKVDIKDYFERLLVERHGFYLEKFEAIEEAFKAALGAQEKLTSASFTASEKAISKAEEAQSQYNIRSNEFRAQLGDQARTLMPRPEAEALNKVLEDKIADLGKRISALNETGSEVRGKEKLSTPLLLSLVGAIFGAAGFLIAKLIGA
jgi:hypothetical protein